jgi:hypothetical protein
MAADGAPRHTRPERVSGESRPSRCVASPSACGSALRPMKSEVQTYSEYQAHGGRGREVQGPTSQVFGARPPLQTSHPGSGPTWNFLRARPPLPTFFRPRPHSKFLLFSRHSTRFASSSRFGVLTSRPARTPLPKFARPEPHFPSLSGPSPTCELQEVGAGRAIGELWAYGRANLNSVHTSLARTRARRVVVSHQ